MFFMKKILQQIQRYAEDSLGLKASPGKSANLNVPFFIKDTYALASMQLTLTEKHKLKVVLVIQKEEAYPGIVSLRKHLNQIHKVTSDPLVYVNSALSAADRKSLISHHINFIQPPTQLFIPELALDISEAYRQKRLNREVDTLFPATQAVLIACFNRGWSVSQACTSSQIAQGLGYSRVTLSKVIDQLIDKDILVTGEKARTYCFKEPVKAVFEKVSPLLKSPVKRVVFIKSIPEAGEGLFQAGETALAKYSMLAEPSTPIYALTQERFSKLRKQGLISEAGSIDEVAATIELWTYPNPLVDAEIADPLSLFLSLKDNKDERIQIALDEMMGDITWLK